VNERDGDGGGLDARYEALRHAALHARAEAFPLGFAVLTRRGVTGWRRALTEVTANHATPAMPASPAPASASLPVAVSAELVDALATVALAGARPDRGAAVHHRNPLHHSFVRCERSPYRCSPTPPHPR
jgi:hypothetical protein